MIFPDPKRFYFAPHRIYLTQRLVIELYLTNAEIDRKIDHPG